jgi:hypothetical protein
MRIAAVIPTRGQERKVFSAWQVERARNLGYDEVFLIDHPPLTPNMDLYERIKLGVQKAIHAECDAVSVIEDDDYYSLSYLDVIRPLLDYHEMVGINRTTYYHLFRAMYKVMVHPGRSSMFCTSFRVDAFPLLPKEDYNNFLDLSWWRYANHAKLNMKLIDRELAVGIKHGHIFGKVGGNGHLSLSYKETDYNLFWLKRTMDEEAYNFFTEVRSAYLVEWRSKDKAK